MPPSDEPLAVDLEPERTAALRAEKLDEGSSPAHHARSVGDVVVAPHAGAHTFEGGYTPPEVLMARAALRRQSARLDLDRLEDLARTTPDPGRCRWCGRREDDRGHHPDGRARERGNGVVVTKRESSG